jgi:hypothetical protein
MPALNTPTVEEQRRSIAQYVPAVQKRFVIFLKQAHGLTASSGNNNQPRCI